MKDRIKSWKTTTICIIALLGLIYKGRNLRGFYVSNFLTFEIFIVLFIMLNNKLKF